MRSYYVIRYSPGPAWPPGVRFRDLDMAAHAEYVKRLFENGAIVLAGPLRDDQGGIVVLEASGPGEAASVIADDPAVKDQVFIGEAHPWRPAFDATGALGRFPSESRSRARERFQAWLEGYKSAWENRDPEAAAALFTPEATYQETPFDAPMRGIDAIVAYWSEAPRTQRDIIFEYEILSVDSESALAHWRATFTREPSGASVALDGILSARLDAEGRCLSFKEWWHRLET